jgi:hypothetical protein
MLMRFLKITEPKKDFRKPQSDSFRKIVYIFLITQLSLDT